MTAAVVRPHADGHPVVGGVRVGQRQHEAMVAAQWNNLSNSMLMDIPPGRDVLCAERIWRQWNAGILAASKQSSRAWRPSCVGAGATRGTALMPSGGAALMPALPGGGSGGGGVLEPRFLGWCLRHEP